MKLSIQYSPAMLLLAAALSLCSCIHDSYDDCPKQGYVDIAMTHYRHNEGNRDLFAQEVNRAEFYIFDNNGLFYRRDVTTDIALSNGYRHRLTLPDGDYTVLSWCNGGTAWLPEAFMQGITTLEEARMKLTAAPTASSETCVVTEMPETLFFGRTQQRQIHVRSGETTNDSIDLMRVTNDIRIRIRWKDHDGVYCTYKGHEEITRPYLEIKNGEYDSDCKPQCERFLSYLPQLLPSEEETPVDYASVRADFRVGRLMAEGSTAKVAVAQVLPDGSLMRQYTRSLVELIRLTGHYDTQEQIDREAHFDVNIDFCCIDPEHTHANSWAVVGITINGWVISDIESEL